MRTALAFVLALGLLGSWGCKSQAPPAPAPAPTTEPAPDAQAAQATAAPEPDTVVAVADAAEPPSLEALLDTLLTALRNKRSPEEVEETLREGGINLQPLLAQAWARARDVDERALLLYARGRLAEARGDAGEAATLYRRSIAFDAQKDVRDRLLAVMQREGLQNDQPEALKAAFDVLCASARKQLACPETIGATGAPTSACTCRVAWLEGADDATTGVIDGGAVRVANEEAEEAEETVFLTMAQPGGAWSGGPKLTGALESVWLAPGADRAGALMATTRAPDQSRTLWYCYVPTPGPGECVSAQVGGAGWRVDVDPDGAGHIVLRPSTDPAYDAAAIPVGLVGRHTPAALAQRPDAKRHAVETWKGADAD